MGAIPSPTSRPASAQTAASSRRPSRYASAAAARTTVGTKGDARLSDAVAVKRQHERDVDHGDGLRPAQPQLEEQAALIGRHPGHTNLAQQLVRLGHGAAHAQTKAAHPNDALPPAPRRGAVPTPWAKPTCGQRAR